MLHIIIPSQRKQNNDPSATTFLTLNPNRFHVSCLLLLMFSQIDFQRDGTGWQVPYVVCEDKQ
jgi:hypothetical protein